MRSGQQVSPTAGTESFVGAEAPRITLDHADALAMEVMNARLFGEQAGPVRVGRFTVIDRLGEGGMGVVYAAYDELLDRKVALKLLHRGGLAGSGDDRLLREAQAMARLSHPNIVSVYEVGQFGAQLFIAMEFVRGASLDAWLGAEARAWQVVLPVLRAAGRGLEAAHRAGIVHRDYKPHNTLVGLDGSVKVADFGLARAHVTDEAAAPVAEASTDRRMLHVPLTQQGAVMGTPAYMAPEQHAGQADERSDQFSFCVTAYQALYGSLPFPTSSLEALLGAVAAGACRPAPPGSLVPPWLRRAVLRGLAADPAQRYPSMTALLEALARDPALVRRRRIRSGLIGAGLGVLGLLGGWVVRSAEGQVCPDGAAELRGVWDEARRGEIGAAMLGTGLAFAGTTWARLEHDLEGYANAWISMHGEACEAHRAGRQSDTQYDLRMRCLEQRRTSLAALTEVLAHVDAESLSGVALAAGALPRVEACGDLEALLDDPLRPPTDPATAPAVARVQAGLARVRALEGTGLYARAVAEAEALAGDAALTGHRPFLAELALYRGRALLNDRPEAADEALSTAFREGLRGGHDRVATEALARRIYVRGYRFGRREDAARDDDLAVLLLDRVDDDGRLRGEYLNNRGAVALGFGEWSQAEALFVAAIAAKTAAFGPDSGELVYTHANLGTLRNDLDRTGAAIEALQAAWTIGARAFGEAHPTVLLVRANLGRAFLKHRRFGDAEAALLAVRDGAAARPDPDLSTIAFVEQQLAWLALEQRRPARARDHLTIARSLLASTGDTTGFASANVEMLLAHCDALAGDHAGALRHQARAGELLAPLVPPEHPRRREFGNEVAVIAWTAGHYTEMLALAEASARQLAADGPGAVLLHARALELTARAQHALGRPEAAIRAAEAALALLEPAIAEENPRLAAALGVLAVSEAAAGRRGEALAHLERAERIYVDCADADLPALAQLRFERARLIAHERPDEAASLARSALVVLTAADGHTREAGEITAWLAQR